MSGKLTPEYLLSSSLLAQRKQVVGWEWFICQSNS